MILAILVPSTLIGLSVGWESGIAAGLQSGLVSISALAGP
jgi:hypothetical protein